MEACTLAAVFCSVLIRFFRRRNRCLPDALIAHPFLPDSGSRQFLQDNQFHNSAPDKHFHVIRHIFDH